MTTRRGYIDFQCFRHRRDVVASRRREARRARGGFGRFPVNNAHSLPGTAGLIAAGLSVDVRASDPVLDSIDGVVPVTIVEPHTAEGVAATLAWASEHRLSVVIRGGGTKMGWGRTPRGVDVLLSMRRLKRMLSHSQGDLTVTAEAGTSLRELNQTLTASFRHAPRSRHRHPARHHRWCLE
jgi:FAD binding domain